jgi:hypothetical protein
MSVPIKITFEIVRTDIEAAKEFLAWLAASEFAYHIDDSVHDCDFAPEIANLIEARVNECFTVLGYPGAWDAYPWDGERKRAADNAKELLDGLRWCIKQMQGDSGTGHSHWEDYPEYLDALATLERIRTGNEGNERLHR